MAIPSKLLEYPDVLAATEHEVSDVRVIIRTASNPGLFWDGWKRKTRKAIIYVESRLRRDHTRKIRTAPSLVQYAEDEFVSTRSSESSRQHERARAVLDFQHHHIENSTRMPD